MRVARDSWTGVGPGAGRSRAVWLTRGDVGGWLSVRRMTFTFVASRRPQGSPGVDMDPGWVVGPGAGRSRAVWLTRGRGRLVERPAHDVHVRCGSEAAGLSWRGHGSWMGGGPGRGRYHSRGRTGTTALEHSRRGSHDFRTMARALPGILGVPVQGLSVFRCGPRRWPTVAGNS